MDRFLKGQLRHVDVPAANLRSTWQIHIEFLSIYILLSMFDGINEQQNTFFYSFQVCVYYNHPSRLDFRIPLYEDIDKGFQPAAGFQFRLRPLLATGHH